MTSIIIASEAKRKAIKVLTRPDHLSMLFHTWPSFAQELEVDEVKIKELRRKIILETCSLPEAILDVIENWVSKKGRLATLDNLVAALHNLELNYIAERLKDDFDIDKEPRCGDMIKNLFNNSLPDKIPYYIQRTLVSRYCLNRNKLFERSATNQDVFCFTGVQRFELTKYVKNNTTDNSSRQIQLSLISTRFIILDSSNHFLKICSKTKEPVHWVEFPKGEEQKETMKWVQSHGNILEIQGLIESDLENQEQLKEAQILQISERNREPLCFSDCPGMGKSILLIQIGQMLRQSFPDKLIIHFELVSFLQKLKEMKSSNVKSTFEKVLINKLCKPKLVKQGKEKLIGIFSSNKIEIELLLDGFDEILAADVTFCLEVIQSLKTLKYCRIWIASRPHFLEKIENALNVLGYNILPFTGQDQIDFLVSYWLSQNPFLSSQRLTKLAEESLGVVSAQINDQDFAGIPLRCLLIGEVFEEQAMDFCTVECQHQDFPKLLTINSTFDLFKRMVEIKLRKYRNIYGTTFKVDVNKMFVKLAMELIFPGWLEIFSKDLGKLKGSASDLINTGLLLQQEGSISIKFIHRTIAEFFCAWYISDILKKHGMDREWWAKTGNAFLEEILKLDEADANYSIRTHKSTGAIKSVAYLENRDVFRRVFFKDNISTIRLRYSAVIDLSYLPDTEAAETDIKKQFQSFLIPFKDSVVLYFLNGFINEKSISQINFTCTPTLLKSLIITCINHNFLNLFKLLSTTFFKRKDEIFIFDKFFLYFLLDSNSEEFIRVGFPFFEKCQTLNLELKLYILTHIAILGNYSIFEYFCKEKTYESILLEGKPEDILYSILTQKSDDAIPQRTQLIRYVLSVNKSFFEDKNWQRVLCNVNYELISCLIEEGMEIGINKETFWECVHHAFFPNGVRFDPERCLQILNAFPLKTLEKLFLVKNKTGKTFFQIYLECLNVTPTILDKFKSAQANFNSRDNSGNNLLMTAVINMRSLETIKYLLNEGANPNHVNAQGQSVLFIWANPAGYNFWQEYVQPDLNILEELIKAGCDVFRQERGCTFLHVLLNARKSFSPSADDFYEIVNILIKKGKEKILETESERKPVSTPLQLAASKDKLHSKTVSLLRSVKTLNFISDLGKSK